MNTIKYNGKEWPLQYVVIDGETLRIASEKMKAVLYTDDGLPVDDEAESIDELIYCYVPDKQFRKNEVRLTKYVEDNFF